MGTSKLGTIALIVALGVVPGCAALDTLLETPQQRWQREQQEKTEQQEKLDARRRHLAAQRQAEAEARQQTEAIAKAAEAERLLVKQQAEAERREGERILQLYESVLVNAGDCDRYSSPADLGRVYAFLSAFESNAHKTAAIAELEKCRKRLRANLKTEMPKVLKEMRSDFAIAVEDGFDEANPWMKGKLTAKVSGSVLNVRVRGTVEGRARHSQEYVDEMCGATDAFSKIVLKSAHGMFACRPEYVSASTWVQAWMDEAGIGEPIKDIDGEQPTPAAPNAAASPPGSGLSPARNGPPPPPARSDFDEQ